MVGNPLGIPLGEKTHEKIFYFIFLKKVKKKKNEIVNCSFC